LAAPGAHLRLLFSQPRLGPATALRSLLTSPGVGATAEASLLDRVVAAEARELERHEVLPAPLLAELGRQGWRLAERSWEEALDLPLAERLLARWFADAAPYRASLLAAGLAPEELAVLRRWFQSHLGARLPQRLGHGVLEGRWPLEPEPTRPKKSPGQRRGHNT
jgi:putative ATPase